MKRTEFDFINDYMNLCNTIRSLFRYLIQNLFEEVKLQCVYLTSVHHHLSQNRPYFLNFSFIFLLKKIFWSKNNVSEYLHVTKNYRKANMWLHKDDNWQQVLQYISAVQSILLSRKYLSFLFSLIPNIYSMD